MSTSPKQAESHRRHHQQEQSKKKEWSRQRPKRTGRRDDPPEVRLSKALSYALRHGAEELKLDMRPSGYVELRQLLSHPKFKNYTETEIEHVVRTNAKKRFTLTTDESGTVKFIRANQGHSLQIVQDDELLTPLEDPGEIEKCIHGTYTKFWESIFEHGLSRMTRNHIHFTTQEAVEGEVVSGMRGNCNLLLYLDFPLALADGIKFYRSSNNVVLSSGIGATGVIDHKYFLKAVHTDGTIVYEREAGA